MPDPSKIEQQAQDLTKQADQLISWISQDPIHAVSTLAIILFFAVVVSIRKRLGDNLADVVDKFISNSTLLAIR